MGQLAFHRTTPVYQIARSADRYLAVVLAVLVLQACAGPEDARKFPMGDFCFSNGAQKISIIDGRVTSSDGGARDIPVRLKVALKTRQKIIISDAPLSLNVDRSGLTYFKRVNESRFSYWMWDDRRGLEKITIVSESAGYPSYEYKKVNC